MDLTEPVWASLSVEELILALRARGVDFAIYPDELADPDDRDGDAFLGTVWTDAVVADKAEAWEAVERHEGAIVAWRRAEAVVAQAARDLLLPESPEP